MPAFFLFFVVFCCLFHIFFFFVCVCCLSIRKFLKWNCCRWYYHVRGTHYHHQRKEESDVDNKSMEKRTKTINNAGRVERVALLTLLIFWHFVYVLLQKVFFSFCYTFDVLRMPHAFAFHHILFEHWAFRLISIEVALFLSYSKRNRNEIKETKQLLLPTHTKKRERKKKMPSESFESIDFCVRVCHKFVSILQIAKWERCKQ